MRSHAASLEDHRHHGWGNDRLAARSFDRSYFIDSWQPPCGVAAGCLCLVGASPVRPLQPEQPLLVRLAQRQNHAADFRHGQRNANALRPPFCALAWAAKAR
jgi:hypothetical protein